MLLLDGHNDLPWALRKTGEVDVAQPQPHLHTDLPRLRAGGVGAQFWSVYVPGGHPEPVTAVFEQVDLVHRLAARYPEHLALAVTADDVERVGGRVASLLGAEGGHCLGGSLGVLRSLRRAGVRYLTLTHNENVGWADSATDVPDAGGLSPFGRGVVAEMNRIGMIVDLSHVAETTMRDALAVTTAPVLFTHSSCRAVTDHPRNVPDEVLARLAANGGVCMVTFVPRFVSTAVAAWDVRLTGAMDAAGRDHGDLGERAAFAAGWEPPPAATLADVLDHLDHAREVAGIEHVGIGGDFDGTPELPVGLEDVSCYPALLDGLRDRGWSDADLARVAGANALRVLRAADGQV